MEASQFEISDRPNSNILDFLPNALKLDNDKIRHEGKLIRLLMGSVCIKNEFCIWQTIEQKTNYLILGAPHVELFSEEIYRGLFSENNESVENYVKRSGQNNISLFKDLVNEYCLFFYYKEKEIHTLSFLYVYRILERMSLTFPMLYATISDDYNGSFNTLRAFFKESNSELDFFKKFTKKILEVEYQDYKVVFNITGENEFVRAKYYEILSNLCSKFDSEREPEAFRITIKNKYTIILLINLRNRYFHFMSGGQENIRSTDLLNPDGFFSLLNEHFINYLSIIYFKLIKEKLSRY